MTERKEAALAALRTWRTTMNDRDRLVRAARDAGATLAEITDASGLAKGTVRTALDTPTDTEETMTTTSPATDPLAGHHHPHYLSGRVTRPADSVSTASYEFSFRPFSGHEPDPEDLEPGYEAVRELPRETQHTLHAEYRAAHIMWSKARFKIQVRPLLEQALPLWQAYSRALSAAEAAFTAFWDTPNDQWNAQQLKLYDAHRELLAAAAQWDTMGEKLARAEYDHYREAGEGYELSLSDVAPEFGLDVKGWILGWDYLDDSSLGLDRERLATKHANKLIDQQRKQLAEVIG